MSLISKIMGGNKETEDDNEEDVISSTSTGGEYVDVQEVPRIEMESFQGTIEDGNCMLDVTENMKLIKLLKELIRNNRDECTSPSLST